MQRGEVYRNQNYVGIIERSDENIYSFQYANEYLSDPASQAISVNFPFQKEPFISNDLFAFFYQFLAEGSLKELQCKELKIDMDDDFSRLLKTTQDDTIGSITIKETIL